MSQPAVNPKTVEGNLQQARINGNEKQIRFWETMRNFTRPTKPNTTSH